MTVLCGPVLVKESSIGVPIDTWKFLQGEPRSKVGTKSLKGPESFPRWE